VWDGTVAAQKALSCAFRTGQRFGAGHLIDVLLGNETDRMVQWGHRELSTFGIGRELDKKQWQAVFRQLVAYGLLAVDHTGYGALKLTPASRAVLAGGERISFRHVREAKRERTAKRESGAAATSGLDGAARELWERLRAWRAAVAKEHGVPAYVIFHDATLAELARERPASEVALSKISGVGARKLERYGADLLELLRA
jgi:ATP-dependent DNA helicase RecQ